MLNPDFRDMLSAFGAEGVEFLVVGGYALALHGLPRATGDLDFWIRRSPHNATRIMRALAAFGAPLDQVTETDLCQPDLIFQLGIEPNRIDIVTAIDGVEFDDAWPNRVVAAIDGVEVPFIGLRDLITNKRVAGRPQDIADVSRLETELVRRKDSGL
ncbi:MAG TPA: nucleotidyltransferase [Gemmatimonadales bacterium]|nr:nucleotidyltransferase [Gemmatimonadales bacterium]